MNIFVFVKRTPSSATVVRIASGREADAGRRIHTDGVEFTFSPFDEIALAAAVQLKQQSPGSQVTAVTLGAPEGATLLRSALALGADRAVLLKADAPAGIELDGYRVARAIADWVRGEAFDVLLFGATALDSQGAQVGPMAARLLGVPSLSCITRLGPAEGGIEAQMLVEGSLRTVRAKLPIALTASKGLAEPRHASVRDILQAKSKPITTVDAELQPARLELLALEPLPARKPGVIVGEGPEAAPELLRLLRDEAKVLR